METKTNKSFFRKFSKYFLVYFLFIFVAANFYLKHSNILIYSNATDDVAMLNIKWGMSPTEILYATDTDFSHIIAEDPTHKSISQHLPLIDETNKTEVNYYFVNNQLYKVRIKENIASDSKNKVAKFIEKIGVDKSEKNIISNLYEGEKYRTENGRQKMSVYIGFDAKDKPVNTYVTMYYKPIADKYEI